jgi:hypothetical protein
LPGETAGDALGELSLLQGGEMSSSSSHLLRLLQDKVSDGDVLGEEVGEQLGGEALPLLQGADAPLFLH